MQRWKRLLAHIHGMYPRCPEDCPRVRFTGDLPRDATEELIVKAAGGRESVALDWLEELVADSLYRQELRRGGWVVDVGVWGPAVFRREARNILRGMRPGFGLLVGGEQQEEAPGHSQSSAR